VFTHLLQRPPMSSLFPYTTLFRSVEIDHQHDVGPDRFLHRAQRLEIVARLGPAHAQLHGAEAFADELSGFGNQRLERHDAEALRSEEHTSELQSLAYLVCRLLLEK